MARTNLLDIAQMNGGDKVVGLIEENLTYAPEVSKFFTRPPLEGNKTSYYTVTRTAYPGVGFRKANEGVTATKSTTIRKLVECFIFGGRVECDKAVGMAHEDGMNGLEMFEADGVMKQALIELGQQIWYGRLTDDKGFPGLKEFLPTTAATVVDATGSTASTASSLYAVKFGLKDVCLVPGAGNVFQLGQFRDETILDSNSAPLPGRVADLLGYIGMQVGNVNCAGRIYNLTADSNKGLTDTLISQLLEKFPVGYTPDAFFCSRRSLGQLQRSRTIVINASGGNKPQNVENVAPIPTEAFGIPIVVTDNILNTDAIGS
jgi:hypothetical protein